MIVEPFTRTSKRFSYIPKRPAAVVAALLVDAWRMPASVLAQKKIDRIAGRERPNEKWLINKRICQGAVRRHLDAEVPVFSDDLHYKS